MSGVSDERWRGRTHLGCSRRTTTAATRERIHRDASERCIDALGLSSANRVVNANAEDEQHHEGEDDGDCDVDRIVARLVRFGDLRASRLTHAAGALAAKARRRLVARHRDLVVGAFAKVDQGVGLGEHVTTRLMEVVVAAKANAARDQLRELFHVHAPTLESVRMKDLDVDERELPRCRDVDGSPAAVLSCRARSHRQHAVSNTNLCQHDG